LHGAIGFPVHNGNDVLGVLEFFSREVRLPDKQFTLMMSTIANQISQFIERRKAEKLVAVEALERRIGQEIQQRLLPKAMPRLSGFKISGRSMAPNVVGGDCFDFVPLPKMVRGFRCHSPMAPTDAALPTNSMANSELIQPSINLQSGNASECLGVLVADASGHGIGAALLITQTQAYLRGFALIGTDVGLLLALINQCLCRDLQLDHFVTGFLIGLDPNTRLLSYTGAGHLPGFVLGSSGQTKAILHSTGIPLGIDPASKFPASSISLEPGDLVLLITDGITEAASAEGSLFGMERTLRIVRQHQHQTPDEIITALFTAVNDYANNNCHDDLTAVIIKIEGIA